MLLTTEMVGGQFLTKKGGKCTLEHGKCTLEHIWGNPKQIIVSGIDGGAWIGKLTRARIVYTDHSRR